MLNVSSARRAWLTSTALTLAASASMAGAAQAQTPRLDYGSAVNTAQITINNNFTPTQARDPVNITGIGQIVTDAGGGSVGLCTGTLINRRTVIFAAHCVNTRPATAYGAGQGGRGIAVGFETNTRANGPGQTDELVQWLLPGANQFKTNTAQALYNINQVTWNPQSVSARSCTNASSCFLEADIAMGALDTPATNVPTWTMLFSPLPVPGTINPATGTGYHVNTSGYGANGNGTTGAGGQDFRRRTAENMLGALTSLSVRDQFLFGGAPSARVQNLYFLDFDDPLRGQAGANPRDFNGFRDNALTREGLTGPGDSGGPLILDRTFATPTIIGVLSGGSTFFSGQPGGSYGTQSFYQPLYLYWDWIVANNPYRYATANAGDGAWEDASRWVTELDPAYQIIAGGNLVNGVPTNVGAGPNGTQPQFGEVCFQSGPVNECENLATGQPRNNVPNNPTAEAPINGELTVDVLEDGVAVAEDEAGGSTHAVNAEAVSERGDLDGAVESPHGADVALATPHGPEAAVETPHAPVLGYSDTVRPAATLANGLPGATNFTPNNTDGVRATGVPARYYDVTLRNAGTTTLSSAVTIDRFAVAGANSALNVATAGSLTSLVDIIQTNGRVNVDGALRTPGDYALIGGLLSGRGTVTTPFLTSVLGTIAPGTIGTIGTLTVSGDVTLSSGSQFAVDVSGLTSDLLRTTANGPRTGAVMVGGMLNLNLLANPIFGQQYTVVAASGGVSGQFSATTDMPGVLRPTITYTPTTVRVSVTADSFAGFVDPNSPSQVAMGGLLDRSRVGYSALSGIYGVVDTLEGQALGAALESLVPYSAQSTVNLARVQTETMGAIVGQRISLDRGDPANSGLTLIGQGVQVAALNENLTPIAAAVMASAKQDAAERAQWNTGWKEGASGFLTIATTTGQAAQLRGTVIGSGEDDQDNWYVAGGLERTIDGFTVGGAASYAEGEAEYMGGLSQTDTRQIQLTAYTSAQFGTVYAGGHVGYSVLDMESRRNVPLGAVTLRADGETDGDILSSGFEVGDRRDVGGGLRITPHFGLNAYRVSIDGYTETGSQAAMRVGEVNLTSAQGFMGLRFDGNTQMSGMAFRPALTVRAVADMFSDDDGVSAAFAAVGASPATFLGASRDQAWGEVAGSVMLGGENLNLTLQAASVFEREDLDYQTYRATVSMKF